METNDFTEFEDFLLHLDDDNMLESDISGELSDIDLNDEILDELLDMSPDTTENVCIPQQPVQQNITHPKSNRNHSHRNHSHSHSRVPVVSRSLPRSHSHGSHAQIQSLRPPTWDDIQRKRKLYNNNKHIPNRIINNSLRSGHGIRNTHHGIRHKSQRHNLYRLSENNSIINNNNRNNRNTNRLSNNISSSSSLTRNNNNSHKKSTRNKNSLNENNSIINNFVPRKLPENPKFPRQQKKRKKVTSFFSKTNKHKKRRLNNSNNIHQRINSFSEYRNIGSSNGINRRQNNNTNTSNITSIPKTHMNIINNNNNNNNRNSVSLNINTNNTTNTSKRVPIAIPKTNININNNNKTLNNKSNTNNIINIIDNDTNDISSNTNTFLSTNNLKKRKKRKPVIVSSGSENELQNDNNNNNNSNNKGDLFALKEFIGEYFKDSKNDSKDLKNEVKQLSNRMCNIENIVENSIDFENIESNDSCDILDNIEIDKIKKEIYKWKSMKYVAQAINNPSLRSKLIINDKSLSCFPVYTNGIKKGEKTFINLVENNSGNIFETIINNENISKYVGEINGLDQQCFLVCLKPNYKYFFQRLSRNKNVKGFKSEEFPRMHECLKENFDLYCFLFDRTYDKTTMDMTRGFSNGTNDKLVYCGFLLMKEIN